jgi:hypothetical protein
VWLRRKYREDNPASPAERKVQRPVPVHQPPEAEVLVEAPGGLVLGIDDERIGGDLLARLQAAIYRAADQQFALARKTRVPRPLGSTDVPPL